MQGCWQHDHHPRDLYLVYESSAECNYIAALILQDVLLYYGATEYGSGPPALGTRSPRQSFNPEDPGFSRERGSYQAPYAEP
jgi:hypothetical protein